MGDGGPNLLPPREAGGVGRETLAEGGADSGRGLKVSVVWGRFGEELRNVKGLEDCEKSPSLLWAHPLTPNPPQ